ncbi:MULTISPECIES: sensor histidine kinase [unclassified Agrococcus]|uniref:sensor histidine kinase n=1 Tax=unclassified Agrococcus TaxID=2615065 RepID=UPI003616C9B2
MSKTQQRAEQGRAARGLSINDRTYRTSPRATALLVVGILGLGVAMFTILTHAAATPEQWVLALGAGLLASAALPLHRSSLALAAVLVLAGNAASLVGIPAMLSLLFLAGVYGSARQQVAINVGAVLTCVVQVGVWVLLLGPERSAGDVAVIALVYALTVVGSAASGAALGRISARREAADLQVATAQEHHAVEVAEVRAQERLRIAHVLHDSIGRHLAVVHIYGSVLQHQRLLSDQEIDDTTTDLLRATDGIAEDLEKILTTLHSEPDAASEPERDLGALLQRFAHAARHASMTLEQDIDFGALAAAPAEVTVTVGDFLAECTTNALKHGRDGTVSITVQMEEPNLLEAHIVNDRPLVPRECIISTGIGLVALRERARLLGGELTITADESRFAVNLMLPVDR